MKALGVWGALCACPLLAFGWGAGHDVVARAVAERLPAPWRERLRGDALNQFCEDNHYPDARTNFTGNPRVTPEEVAYLAQKRMTDSGQFHTDEGRGVAFTLLVRALRENRPAGALLWLGALAHSTADMAACNHDPIVHLATYGWGDPAWNIRLPDGTPISRMMGSLDLGWVAGDPETRRIWARGVSTLSPSDPGKSGADTLLDVLLDGIAGVEVCAPRGAAIARDAASWSVTRDPQSRAALAESLTALGGWAVERVLCDFLAAERLAQAGPAPEVDEAVLARYRAALSEFTAARPFGADSLVKGLATPQKRGAFVGVTYEPTWRMNDGMLGFNDRVLAAQTVNTLRSKGANAALVDVRAVMAGGCSASNVTALVVFAQKLTPFYTLKPEALAGRLAAYRKEGGKIVWIGGVPPDRALCDFPANLICSVPIGKNYSYSWTRLPVETNAYASLRLSICSHEERRLARTPSFRAGWHIPSNTSVLGDNAEAQVVPLARLLCGERTLLVGGAWPKARPTLAYLPTYAVYPYLWTDESPSLVPFALALDAQGQEALDAALDALGAHPFPCVR